MKYYLPTIIVKFTFISWFRLPFCPSITTYMIQTQRTAMFCIVVNESWIPSCNRWITHTHIGVCVRERDPTVLLLPRGSKPIVNVLICQIVIQAFQIKKETSDCNYSSLYLQGIVGCFVGLFW